MSSENYNNQNQNQNENIFEKAGDRFTEGVDAALGSDKSREATAREQAQGGNEGGFMGRFRQAWRAALGGKNNNK